MTTNRTIGPSPPPLWRRAQRWGVNALIVLFLVAAAVQGLPLNMPAATNYSRWATDWIGVSQETWNMYAPAPDRQNHRVTAEVMSSFEHVVARWSMPEWRKLSAFDRFWLHRWSEYYDHVWQNYNTPCWPALAQHVVRTSKIPYSPDEDPPRQVKLIVESTNFPAPSGSRWPKPVPPEQYDDRWVLWIEQLHLGPDAQDADSKGSQP